MKILLQLIYTTNLRHGSGLQEVVSVASPVQLVPPNCAGVMMVLFLVRVPLPQVAEQEDQSVKFDNTQLMANIKFKKALKHMTFCFLILIRMQVTQMMQRKGLDIIKHII